jgi:tetratricopeptide (TPR) repeat protein
VTQSVPPLDARVTNVRQLAADGCWRDVCAILSPIAAEAGVPSELLLLRGEAHLRTGDASGARAWVPSALVVARQGHDRISERTLLNQLGVASFHLGQLDDAERAFLQALELGQRDGDDLLVARASNNLGMIANVRGHPAIAVGLYQLAIPAYQRLGQARGLAETYHNLALTAREQGQLDQSENYERRAIEYADHAGDERLLVMAEIGLAEISLSRGDALLAERRSLVAARRCEVIGDPVNEADALRNAGAALLARRREAAASGILERAVRLARMHGAPLVEAEALWERAKYHVLTENVGAAREDAEQAARIFDELRSPQGARVRAWLDDV